MREVSATLGYVPNITDCFFCICIFELFQWEVFFYTGFGTATTTTTTADKFGKTLSFFAVSINCVEITKLMNLDKVSINKK